MQLGFPMLDCFGLEVWDAGSFSELGSRLASLLKGCLLIFVI